MDKLRKMVKIQSLALESPRMKLRDWMNEVRLGIGEFSALMGISRSYTHMILNGDKIPSQVLLDKISDISMGKVSRFEDLIS